MHLVREKDHSKERERNKPYDNISVSDVVLIPRRLSQFNAGSFHGIVGRSELL